MSGIVASARQGSGWATLRRGLALSPEMTSGLAGTLALSLASTVGRVVVPVAVQQTIDRGILGQDGGRPRLVLALVAAALAGVALTAVTAYLTNVRIFTATESGLATLRVRAFRHIHDLSVTSQNSELRGALVARVTTDVDTISTFVQFGGLLLVTSTGQLLVATVLMIFYSPPLALLVWACYLPLFAALRTLQRIVARAYAVVRERVGAMLGAVAESVVGAEVIRAYGVAGRTQARIDEAVTAHARSAVRAQVLVASSFSGGVLLSGLVVAAVVGVGTWTGVGGGLTLGQLLAFLFLVQLFTGPVQLGTEVLNELQNALAGWRRVLAVLDTPAQVADPGPDGVDLPPGPLSVRLDGVSYAYPHRPPVLTDVHLDVRAGRRVAVVGETGSGKSTLTSLITRLADPARGSVLIGGIDLRRVRFASLRTRVVLVPQEGFLLDTSLAGNLAWGRPDLTVERIRDALADLGLLGWADGLPAGLDTPVGQRGESLSAGERQLVALARAHLADPDLLVLDEATSSVDPATEVRLRKALDGLTRSRTSITVAHRLSTAEAADLVVVVDAGRVADVGPHADLLARCPAYERLYASWAGRHEASGVPA
jgi:ATP-binding cassette subfamily B protein